MHTSPRLRGCDVSCHSCVSHPALISPICLPSSAARQAAPTGGLTGDACAAKTDCSPGRGCGRLQNDGSIATCSDPSDACFCFPTDFEICDASGECIPGEVCAQEAQGNVQLCVAKTSPLLEEAEEEEKENVVAVDAGMGDKDLPTVPPVTTVPQAPPVTPPFQKASPEPEAAQESAPVTTPAPTAAVTTPTAVPVEETPTETAVASAEPSVAAGSQEPAPVAVPAPGEGDTTTETDTGEETASETETESETDSSTEEAGVPVPAGTTDTETESTEEDTTTGATDVPSETDEEEEASEDPSATGEDDESVDGATVDDDDDADAEGDDGDDDDDEDEVCIGAHHLQGVDSLVYDSHRKAKVLCDSMGSCATPGHIVHWKGEAMMMASYCELVEEDCVRKSMMVNSPSWRRGLRVKSLTTDLEFTAFAARYATRTEERLLTTAVRMGL